LRQRAKQTTESKPLFNNANRTVPLASRDQMQLQIKRHQ
jgi:hypothetical protein